MNSKFFWRNVVYALAAINLLFWLWNDGRLSFLGLGPKPVQEPHRVETKWTLSCSSSRPLLNLLQSQ